MGLIKRKVKQTGNKNSIIVSLTSTITELEEYLKELESGNIHNQINLQKILNNI